MLSDIPLVQIDLSPEYKQNLRTLSKRYRNIRADTQDVFEQIQAGNFVGDRVAGLGENYIVIKVRVKNSNIQKGKSAGYRLVYQVESPTNVLLLTIYSKSDRDDISSAEIFEYFVCCFQAMNSDKPCSIVDTLVMEAKMTELLTPQSLYDQDILLWVEDTIAKLKAHDFANLDLENLIEEIDTLGKSQRNAIRSLLRRLIEHLLKRCYVPLPECYVGWQKEIRAFRNDIKDILEDAPSLKNQISEILPKVFETALSSMKEEYPQVNFPNSWLENCDVNDILNRNFWENS